MNVLESVSHEATFRQSVAVRLVGYWSVWLGVSAFVASGSGHLPFRLLALVILGESVALLPIRPFALRSARWAIAYLPIEAFFQTVILHVAGSGVVRLTGAPVEER